MDKHKARPLDSQQKTLADAPQHHIYTAADGKSYDLTVADNEIWMSQKEMAQLFNVSVQAVGKQIRNVIRDDKLDNSVISKSFITAADGKSYEVSFYNLKVIIPVGFRLNNSKEATQFRAWATDIIQSYLTIGVVINEPLLESREILKKQNIVEKHDRAGLGNHPNILHTKAELDVARSLKLMNEMLSKVVSNPQYGRLHNAKLQTLFGLKSEQIKALLACKNIHEAMPTMQLEFIDFAHKRVIQILQMQANGEIDNERAIAAIELAVKPLGDYLHALCEQLGIHPVSGLPLLNAKN